MIDLTKHDFVDFGSGYGGSLQYAKRKLDGYNGLGIEHHVGRCNDLVKKGYRCINANITKLALPKKSVKFVTISHVLEHLKSNEDVKTVIKLAINTATDFVFIEGPAFEFDEYLHTLDLKFQWSEGHGHHTKVTIANVIDYAIKQNIRSLNIH